MALTNIEVEDLGAAVAGHITDFSVPVNDNSSGLGGCDQFISWKYTYTKLVTNLIT